MNGDAGPLVTWAHPEIIGGDGSHLGTKKILYPFIPQAVNRFQRREGVAEWNKVLRLQFFATARGEIHAKVRQAFMPGTGHAHLFRAIFRRKLDNRMQVPLGRCSAVKLRLDWRRFSFSNKALNPDFADDIFLPIRDQDDRLTARHNGFKALFHFAQGHVLINILPDLIAWLNVECYLGYDAKPAESHHCAEELVAVLFLR